MENCSKLHKIKFPTILDANLILVTNLGEVALELEAQVQLLKKTAKRTSQRLFLKLLIKNVSQFVYEGDELERVITRIRSAGQFE